MAAPTAPFSFMPRSVCSCTIDPDVKTALVRLSGSVTGHQIAACADGLRTSPDWSDDVASLWDARHLTSLDVTPGGLEDMVESQTDSAVGPDVIVSADPDHVMLLRLYAWRVRGRGRPATVCATLDEALGVLGLDRLPSGLEDAG